MKNFEERMNRLEEINENINSRDISIEKAMSIFEEGIRIAKSLQKDLDKMERKVEILVNQPDAPETNDEQKPNLQLFPELEE